MLCLGMWDGAPLEFSLLTFQSRPLNVQICMVVQSCMSLEEERKTVFVCLLVHLVCVYTPMCLMNVNTTASLRFLLRCPVCRLPCSHVERPLHNNEKWQKREYHSRLWPGLAGSLRPGAPRWQSPYFWEDGPLIRLIYFTHPHVIGLWGADLTRAANHVIGRGYGQKVKWRNGRGLVQSCWMVTGESVGTNLRLYITMVTLATLARLCCQGS